MAQTTLHDYLQQTEHAISAGRLDDALEHCQYLLNQFPDALEAQRLLGKVYLAQGYLEEAQQTFDWVLTNDPENVQAYCDRAALSERMSDVDTALDCYQQAYELSRGEGRIRREFNQLSARAGQAGFMFSRAGLARLYMRGDLLAEAIQEWEIVLASSPDRLDARLGLMETCWHEGKYERTEQLARQIMQDVPGSLKALLLLAFFAAPKNMQEANRLVQKAEALDPELVLAQELFKDIKASQPDHPFLQFLNKGPVYITDQVAKTDSAVSSDAEADVNKVDDVLVAANTLPHWGDMKNWNGIDTLDNSPSPAPAEALNQIKSTLNGAHGDGDQNGLPTAAPTQSYAFDTSDSSDSWERLTNDNASYTSNSWSSSVEEKQTAAPPSWLNMLTQSEPQQVAEPSVKLPDQREETAIVEPQAAPAYSEDAAYQQLGYMPVLQESAQTSDEDEEESFFGPEWLKSLGAASFSGISPSVEMPAASAIAPTEATSQPPAALPVEATPEPALAPQPAFEQWQTSMAQPEVTYEPWLGTFQQSSPYETNEEPQVEQTAGEHLTPALSMHETATTADVEATADEQLLNSLQGLESDLHAQGFVPLEPNSLAVIAQDKQEASPEQEVQPIQPAQAMLEEKPQEAELSLFAALAEFGNLEPPVAASVASSQQGEQGYATPPADEPSWLASFRMTAAPEPTVPPQLPVTRKTTMPLQPAAAMPVASQPIEATPTPEQKTGSKQPAQEIPALQPVPVPPVRVDALPGPVFTPTYEPEIGSKKLPEPVKVPSARSDIGFGSDLELEVTMKRPVIHLQAMQAQRNTAFPAEQSASAQRTRAGERSFVGKPTDANMNFRDRLVKGYQHQLVGEYDEAMQDYRVIVRNAPDLLGEVVSNLRALLKLAPKYAAGYRVLGDAYMRQGEYLQAMESYNKALTVAKKARS